MTTNEQHFWEAQSTEELKFRGFATSKEIKRFVFTPLDSPYDVKFQSGSTYIIAETKVRDEFKKDFFFKHGPILELKKIEGMVKEQKRIKEQKGIDVTLMYFNFCQDGLLIYQLEEAHNYNFNWKLLPKNSFTDEKEHKLVTYLQHPIEILKTK